MTTIAGFATRKRLHEAVHRADQVFGDVPCVPTIAPALAPERRADTLLGYRRFRDDEEIPVVQFQAGGHGLGTPAEAARVKGIRARQRLVRIAKDAISVLIVVGVFAAGPTSERWAGRHDGRQALAQAFSTHPVFGNCYVDQHREVVRGVVHSFSSEHC